MRIMHEDWTALCNLANLSMDVDDSGFLDDKESEIKSDHSDEKPDSGATPIVLEDGSVIIGDTLFVVWDN